MRYALLAAAALSATLVLGCKDDSTKMKSTSTSTTTDMPATSPTVGEKVNAATQSVGEKMDAGKDKLTEAAGNLGAKIDTAKDKAAVATVPSTPSTPSDTAGVPAEAKTLYEKAEAAIKSGKLDVAESALQKLDGMKSSLSPEWQAKVDSLKTMYEGAKKGNFSIPGLGK